MAKQNEIVPAEESNEHPPMQDENPEEQEIGSFVVKMDNGSPLPNVVATVESGDSNRPKGDQNKPSPENRAGFFSMLFFYWVNPLFNLSKKKRKKDEEIEKQDLWNLMDKDTTALLTQKFQKGWDSKTKQIFMKHQRLGKVEAGANHEDFKDDFLSEGEALSALYSAMWAAAGWPMMLAGVVKFINSCFQFSFPFFLNGILAYMNDVENRPKSEGYLYATALIVAMLLRSLSENNYYHRVVRCSYQVRSSVTTSVYRKSLRLSASSRQEKTIGEIVNIMQLDATKLEQFGLQFHVMWDGILQITGYLVLLYYYIGWATFVGLGVMAAAVPFNLFVMKKLLNITNKMVVVTDSRVKVTNECLQGILGVKMAAWEENFVNTIDEMRAKEIKSLRGIVYFRGFIFSFMSAMPAITASAAIAAYALSIGEVNAPILFTAIATFNQLRFPLMFYPQAIAGYAQARVSLKRVANFLAMEEIDEDAIKESGAESTNAIAVRDGEFYWANPHAAPEVAEVKPEKNNNVSESKKEKRLSGNPKYVAKEVVPALSNINCEIKRNQITAIIGPVGSGKSSFCNSILGELYKSKGEVTVNGSIAYAAQSPWILNATVRDNICFGEPFDKERYWRVVKVCQLTHDFEVLQAGDKTMIGERGINLSGGQKQRISIARAAYSKKDIVILDDPLSALDPGVANKLFNECIVKFLKDRTVVLVTNQLNFLKQCAWIVVLSANVISSGNASEDSDDGNQVTSGYISEQGTFATLSSAGLNFSDLLEKFTKGAAQKERETSTEDVKEATSGSNARRESTVIEAVDEKAPDTLMQTEERNRGSVEFAQYSGYIKSGGGWCFFFLVYISFLLSQGALVFNTQWISLWTASAENGYQNFTIIDIPEDDVDMRTPLVFYIVGYAVTAVMVALFSFLRTVSMALLGLVASKTIHKQLLTSILGAPMSFFDTTPIGRIIARFSNDLFLLDNQVSQFFNFFLFTTTSVASTLTIITITTPIFGAFILPMVFIYTRILQQFRPVIRDMKRLESISRSPIYAHFSETLGGLSTIRAYGETSKFEQDNSIKVDNNIVNFYWMKASDRWLGIRLEILGGVVALLATFLAIISAQQGTLTASEAGLSLTFATTITGLLNFTVRSFAELEAGMNSVERLFHYSKNIEQEAERSSDNPPDKSWPSKGDIVISNLKMRYRPETPLVIKGISLTIKGGHRVGIVGRTGSGKSSFMLCLLRLVEPEFDGPTGPIVLDGVDITKIGLGELRKRISIVPQNPVIFSGTIRENLDPFNLYTDNDIWSALSKTNLKAVVSESPGKLAAPVAEFGENFSQGQRQLLCLARSLLEKSKVLLLDEATSSVDFETDELIQKTIRSKDSFGGCTILTIAHRINTVIDNDRILVLESGEIGEYDAPQTLLANPRSILSSMVGESNSK